jgi:hypothetical protein
MKSCNSLADLIVRVESEGLGYTDGSRETIARAIRRHGRILARRLETISADPEMLDDEAARIVWAAHGFPSHAAYRQHVAKVVGAARRTAGGRRGRADLSDAWQRIADAIERLPVEESQRIRFRARFSSLKSFAVAVGISEPAGLTDNAVEMIDRSLSGGW